MNDELNYLIPNELEADVQKIKRIAFPSVLEMLQNGVGKGAGQRMEKVFSHGLSANTQNTRFQSLTYQHRMHPDIAILILAGELHAKGQEYITPNLLKQFLLPNLPERACWNLLNRIEEKQYFEKSNYSKDYFKLTNLGKECIESKSIWVGEKGIYNLYITESPFVSQKIVAVTRVESKVAQDSGKAQLTHSNFEQNDFEQSFNIGVKLSAEQTDYLKTVMSQWQLQMYQWIDKQLVKNLNNYYLLNDRNLTTEIVGNLKADKISKEVQTVKQLIDFVQKKHTFSNKNYQAQALTLEVQIQPFKKAVFAEKEYEEENYEQFDVVKEYSVTVEKDKNRLAKPPVKQLKTAIIVLHSTFDIWNNYTELLDYQNFMIRVR